MLKKMIIHGLVAAALIGTAAAVYAEGRHSGYLSPDAASTSAADIDTRQLESRGYLSDSGQRNERHESFFEDREHHDEERTEYRWK